MFCSEVSTFDEMTFLTIVVKIAILKVYVVTSFSLDYALTLFFSRCLFFTHRNIQKTVWGHCFSILLSNAREMLDLPFYMIGPAKAQIPPDSVIGYAT